MNAELTQRAADVIFGNEGGYTSVNADDNGAVSVGRLQWHGTRALRLLKKITSALGEGGSLRLVTPELYREIISARTWSQRTVSTYEKVLLTSLLSTPESREVQDEQAHTDVEGYLTHAQGLGITDERAMIFLADIENQGGAGAAERIAKNAPEPTIEGLFVSARGDRVFSRYMTRRERVYALLTGHRFGEEEYGGVTYEVRRGDTLSAIAREYSTTVRELAALNGIASPDRIFAGQLLRIPSREAENNAPTENAPTDNAPAEGGDDRDREESTASAPECGGGLHRVVRGDTLSALARAHGVTVARILESNRAKYPAMTADFIVVGWELTIPQRCGDDRD